MVIDGNVQIFPALAIAFAAVTVYSMANTINLCQFFDVDMDDLAGRFALVSAWFFWRNDVTFVAQAMPL